MNDEMSDPWTEGFGGRMKGVIYVSYPVFLCGFLLLFTGDLSGTLTQNDLVLDQQGEKWQVDHVFVWKISQPSTLTLELNTGLIVQVSPNALRLHA